jgi:prepilin-type N-terminal cleavage/methylation domain-containing protein
MHLRLRPLGHPRRNLAIRGVTLIEALVTISVVGVLAAIAAPNVTKIGSKPLPDTANQVAGVFRSARARAIATTSPIKIKPKGRQAVPNGTSTGGLNTQFEVLRATSTNAICNTEDTTVWKPDKTLSEEYLTLGKASDSVDKKITLQATQVDPPTPATGFLSDPTGWEVCFNTRGMTSTTTTTTNNFVGNDVILTFQEGTDTTKRRRVEIFPAGGIQIYDN